MTNSCFVYKLNAIPDCTHHRLVTLCGGDVRQAIFRAHEQLLRMAANFEPGRLTLSIRFLFDPDTESGLQNRLHTLLLVKTGEGIPADVVRQLIDAGPLCEFYEFKPAVETNDSDSNHGEPASPCAFPFPNFPWIYEVIRLEDRVEAEVSKELNQFVPSAGFYYSAVPFEARNENDYLMLDAVFSKMDAPCMVELTIAPECIAPDVRAHDKYLRRLMAVNQYGDDVYIGNEQDSVDASCFPEDSNPLRPAVDLKKKRDPAADEILGEQQEYHRALRQPHLLFHVKAFAARKENALMLASTVAESGFNGGKYRLLGYGSHDADSRREWFTASVQDSRELNVSLYAKYPGIWDEELPKGWLGLARLAHLATVDELKGVFRLPVGGYGSPRCTRKATDPKPACIADSVLIGDDLESGNTQSRSYPDDLSELFFAGNPDRLENRLPLRGLTKHLFVSGVPGSGKTTAVFNLLAQLHQAGVPFLVIEPAKTEYRVLKTMREHPDANVRDLAARLRVYTPGNDRISPLRFNPFAFPEAITLDEHVSQILACFEAAMPMGGPLQALIAEAVEEVYREPPDNHFPQMMDLLHASRRIMETKQYAGEVQSNLQAAIEVRLGMLTRRAMGRIFQCQRGVPSPRDLLDHPTLIEMDYLSQDGACLLTLFILAAIREEIRVDPKRRASGLHHVTVIEEAHNIVGRAGKAKASEEAADPKAFAAQYVSRMLAELRALGEGIVIADQLPSTVAPEVVKNTGTKLAHRLVSKDDREDLGGAMLLGSTEMEEIARLSPGEAYFYTEGLYRPRRVRCLNANAYLRLTEEAPAGAAILEHLAADDWFSTSQAQVNEEKSAVLLDLTLQEIEALSAWCGREAFDEIAALHEEWAAVCLGEDGLETDSFRSRCGRLLEECERVQGRIVTRCETFTASARDMLTGVRACGNGGGSFLTAANALMDRWNEAEHPRLMELVQCSVALEERIRNVASGQVPVES
ncbi:MAG: hypothetical protein GC154_16910 [bacterium]|nr:hypothetical protein [bacterium]